MSFGDGVGSLPGGAVLGSIDPRRAIGLTGRDRASYLQGLLTNDIAGLVAGSGCYAAWLTPQGRMLTDLHVLESGEMILMDVPETEHAATLARLEQYLFSEDVQITDLTGSLRAVWVHGPEAAQVLERVTVATRGSAPEGPVFPLRNQYQNVRATMGDEAVVVTRIDQLGVPGYCVHVAAPRERAFIEALEAAGARTVSTAVLERARIEAAYPLFGIDMTNDTIPLEADIESRAISLSKGCYVGQEVIIRVLHRGQGRVARKLVQLRVTGALPSPGTKLRVGEREVGWVTSVAKLRVDDAIALAYLHRDFLQPGTLVDVDTPGAPASARVTVPAQAQE